MAKTTGTTAFNLDMNDLIEEAFERCGQELRTGYNFRTARRSLNILTIEWANRGLNFWTVEHPARRHRQRRTARRHDLRDHLQVAPPAGVAADGSAFASAEYFDANSAFFR